MNLRRTRRVRYAAVIVNPGDVPVLVGFRVVPGRPGPFGVFGLFRHHLWFCTDCVSEVYDQRGCFIVRSADGVVRELSMGSAADYMQRIALPALPDEAEPVDIFVVDASLLYSFKLILVQGAPVVEKTCDKCGTEIGTIEDIAA